MTQALSRRRDFERLRADGSRSRSGPLSMTALRPVNPPSLVAFAIPTSAGSSVKRHLVRRRLKAIFDQLDRIGDLVPGWYLVSFRSSGDVPTSQVLRQHLLELLSVQPGTSP